MEMETTNAIEEDVDLEESAVLTLLFLSQEDGEEAGQEPSGGRPAPNTENLGILNLEGPQGLGYNGDIVGNGDVFGNTVESAGPKGPGGHQPHHDVRHYQPDAIQYRPGLDPRLIFNNKNPASVPQTVPQVYNGLYTQGVEPCTVREEAIGNRDGFQKADLRYNTYSQNQPFSPGSTEAPYAPCQYQGSMNGPENVHQYQQSGNELNCLNKEVLSSECGVVDFQLPRQYGGECYPNSPYAGDENGYQGVDISQQASPHRPMHYVKSNTLPQCLVSPSCPTPPQAPQGHYREAPQLPCQYPLEENDAIIRNQQSEGSDHYGYQVQPIENPCFLYRETNPGNKVEGTFDSEGSFSPDDLPLVNNLPVCGSSDTSERPSLLAGSSGAMDQKTLDALRSLKGLLEVVNAPDGGQLVKITPVTKQAPQSDENIEYPEEEPAPDLCDGESPAEINTSEPIENQKYITTYEEGTDSSNYRVESPVEINVSGVLSNLSDITEFVNVEDDINYTHNEGAVLERNISGRIEGPSDLTNNDEQEQSVDYNRINESLSKRKITGAVDNQNEMKYDEVEAAMEDDSDNELPSEMVNSERVITAQCDDRQPATNYSSSVEIPSEIKSAQNDPTNDVSSLGTQTSDLLDGQNAVTKNDEVEPAMNSCHRGERAPNHHGNDLTISDGDTSGMMDSQSDIASCDEGKGDLDFCRSDYPTREINISGRLERLELVTLGESHSDASDMVLCKEDTEYTGEGSHSKTCDKSSNATELELLDGHYLFSRLCIQQASLDDDENTENLTRDSNNPYRGYLLEQIQREKEEKLGEQCEDEQGSLLASGEGSQSSLQTLSEDEEGSVELPANVLEEYKDIEDEPVVGIPVKLLLTQIKVQNTHPESEISEDSVDLNYLENKYPMTGTGEEGGGNYLGVDLEDYLDSQVLKCKPNKINKDREGPEAQLCDKELMECEDETDGIKNSSSDDSSNEAINDSRTKSANTSDKSSLGQPLVNPTDSNDRKSEDRTVSKQRDCSEASSSSSEESSKPEIGNGDLNTDHGGKKKPEPYVSPNIAFQNSYLSFVSGMNGREDKLRESDSDNRVDFIPTYYLGPELTKDRKHRHRSTKELKNREKMLSKSYLYEGTSASQKQKSTFNVKEAKRKYGIQREVKISLARLPKHHIQGCSAYLSEKKLVAKTKDPVPKSEDPVPKSEDLLPKSEDPVPKSKDPLPKPEDPVPKSEDPVPKSEDPVPKSEDLVPKSKDLVPKSRAPVPKTKLPVPKTDQQVPKTKQPVPKTDQQVPKSEAPVPETKQPVPKTDQQVPKTKQPVPKTKQPVPKTDQPVPKTDVISPSLLERMLTTKDHEEIPFRAVSSVPEGSVIKPNSAKHIVQSPIECSDQKSQPMLEPPPVHPVAQALVSSDTEDTVILENKTVASDFEVRRNFGIRKDLRVLVRKMSEDLIDSYVKGDLREKLVVIPDRNLPIIEAEYTEIDTSDNVKVSKADLQDPDWVVESDSSAESITCASESSRDEPEPRPRRASIVKILQEESLPVKEDQPVVTTEVSEVNSGEKLGTSSVYMSPELSNEEDVKEDYPTHTYLTRPVDDEAMPALVKIFDEKSALKKFDIKKLKISVDKLPIGLIQCQKLIVLEIERVKGLDEDGHYSFWALLKGKWIKGKDPPSRRRNIIGAGPRTKGNMKRAQGGWPSEASIEALKAYRPSTGVKKPRLEPDHTGIKKCEKNDDIPVGSSVLHSPQHSPRVESTIMEQDEMKDCKSNVNPVEDQRRGNMKRAQIGCPSEADIEALKAYRLSPGSKKARLEHNHTEIDSFEKNDNIPVVESGEKLERDDREMVNDDPKDSESSVNPEEDQGLEPVEQNSFETGNEGPNFNAIIHRKKLGTRMLLRLNGILPVTKVRRRSIHRFAITAKCRGCQLESEMRTNFECPAGITIEYLCPSCSTNQGASTSSEENTYLTPPKSVDGSPLTEFPSGVVSLSGNQVSPKKADTICSFLQSIYETVKENAGVTELAKSQASSLDSSMYVDVCDSCEYHPTSLDDVVRHRWNEHEDCSCSTCNINFMLPEQLHTHLKLHKTEELTHCILCGQSANNFFCHLYECHQLENCTLCGLKITSTQHLEEHLNAVKVIKFESGKYFCPKDECGFSIHTLDLVLKHLWEFHGQKHCPLCPECSAFVTLDDLLLHMSCHAGYLLDENLDEGNSSFWAEVCTEGGEDTFKNLVKPPNINHMCNLCGLKFSTLLKLTKHRWFVHGNTLPDANDFYFPAQLATFLRLENLHRYTCWECGTKEVGVAELAMHLWHEHTYRGCFICFEKCNSLSRLKTHLEYHEQLAFTKVNCPYVICNDKHYDLQGLVVHQWTCHGERRCLYCDAICETQEHFWNHAVMHNCCEIPCSENWVSYLTKGKLVFNQKCPLCSFSGPTAEILYVHLHDEHGTRKCLRCQEYIPDPEESDCPWQQSSISNYIFHMQEHQAYEQSHVCGLCGVLLTDPTQHRTHMHDIHGVNSDSAFKCNTCNNSFKTLTMVTNHVNKLHEKALNDLSRVYSCEQCSLVFQGSKWYERHKLAHDDKMFSCVECGLSFPTRKELKEHIPTHPTYNVQTFSCIECGVSFQTRKELKLHTLESHRLNVKTWDCAECKESFQTRKELRLHEIETHRLQTVKTWNCTQCDECFTTKKEMLLHGIHAHGTQNVRTWQCNECEEFFLTRKELNLHSLKHPKYKVRKELKIHTLKHPKYKVRLYSCAECKERFQTRTELMEHAHTHPKFECNICPTCNKQFAKKAGLQAHMLVHTEDRPFKCSICEKGFKTKCNVRRHEHDVHGVANPS